MVRGRGVIFVKAARLHAPGRVQVCCGARAGSACANSLTSAAQNAGKSAGLRLVIDGRALGPARAGVQMPLVPGAHILMLLDPGGRTLDRVRFTVR